MRRALGLDGEAFRPRSTPERTDPIARPVERFSGNGHKRRFVHDGEVPVTVVHGLISGRREHGNSPVTHPAPSTPPTNRLEVAEAALTAEIANRERIERELKDAQAAVHDLRTKLGHADLARQEAVGALQRERETMSELRALLYQAQEQAKASREAQEAAERALAQLQDRQADLAEPVEEAAPPPRRRGRPRAPAPQTVDVEPVAAQTAIALPTSTPAVKKAARGRKPAAHAAKETASGREPKPIRWWITPRAKQKR